jgi:hypothetical protein
MRFGDVSFSVASHAAWLAGIDSPEAWQRWTNGELSADGSGEPAVKSMPPMLRRRASAAAKFALETAYQCLPATENIPVVFASRHGECARSVELLQELAAGLPLSPTSFSLSVHNASAGLLSIARREQGNSIAIAAGRSTVEHGVIEACGLLADGAPQVLLVAFDGPLPEQFDAYRDCHEQAYGWAWLMQAEQTEPQQQRISLSWHAPDTAKIDTAAASQTEADGLAVLRFFLRGGQADTLSRQVDGRCWNWSFHA